MANKTATLYVSVKVNKKWTFQKVSSKRLTFLAKGSYYLSWYLGKKKQMQQIGRDPAVALAPLDKKEAELSFVSLGGQILSERTRRDRGGGYAVGGLLDDERIFIQRIIRPRKINLDTAHRRCSQTRRGLGQLHNFHQKRVHSIRGNGCLKRTAGGVKRRLRLCLTSHVNVGLRV